MKTACILVLYVIVFLMEFTLNGIAATFKSSGNVAYLRHSSVQTLPNGFLEVEGRVTRYKWVILLSIILIITKRFRIIQSGYCRTIIILQYNYSWNNKDIKVKFEQYNIL